MNRKFITAITLSLTAHLAVLAALFALGLLPFELRPQGDGSDVTFVGMVGGPSPSPCGREKAPSPQTSPSRRGGISDTTSTTGSETAGSNSSAGSLTGDPTLAKIRNKIARNKYYPTEARRGKLEGKPKVSFKLDQSGNISLLEIAESSGSEILDKAALETIRRGAPYPVFNGEIKIAIKYSLNE